MNEMNEDARKRIAEFLPAAIVSALKSYREFLRAGPPEIKDGEDGDPAKNFKSHHDACKVAIAHIELLIKLGKAVEAEAENLADAEQDQLFKTLAQAQAEIDLQKTNEDEDA